MQKWLRPFQRQVIWSKIRQTRYYMQEVFHSSESQKSDLRYEVCPEETKRRAD